MSDPTTTLLDRLFEGDATERALTLRKEFHDAYKEFMAEPSKRLKKAVAAGAYFKVMAYILKKRLPKDDAPTIALTRAELLFIDFGFIFPDLLSEPWQEIEAFLEKIQWNGGSRGYLRFFTHSGWLNEEYMKMMGLQDLRRMDEEIARLKGELQALGDEKDRLRGEVLALVDAAYPGPEQLPARKTVASIIVNLYRLTEGLYQLKKKVQQGQALSGEERITLNTLEDRQVKMRRERNGLLRDTRVEQKIYVEITTVEDRFFRKIDEHLTKWHEVERAERKREEFAVAKAGTPRNLREEFIGGKVEELKNMLDFTAKRSKVSPFPFLTKRFAENFPEQILRAVLDCEKNDPELFKVKGIRLQGMPGVIIAPGQGEGFYNFENHMFYIPIDFANKLEDSVIHAITIFKWDMDETRELRDAFAELKPYRGKSFVELQQGLFREYHTFVTKECRGYRVMDKEIRDWFQWKIAPKKDAASVLAKDQPVDEKALLAGDSAPAVATLTGDIPVEAEAPPDPAPVAGIATTETAEAPPPPAPGVPFTQPPPGSPAASFPSPAPPSAPHAAPAYPSPPASSGGGVDFGPPPRDPPRTVAERAQLDLLERLNKLLKWPDARDRIRFRRSESGGDVDLLIRGISLSDTEPELLFNALLIQAKLRRLRGLEHENWDRPAEPAAETEGA